MEDEKQNPSEDERRVVYRCLCTGHNNQAILRSLTEFLVGHFEHDGAPLVIKALAARTKEKPRAEDARLRMILE